MALMRQTDRRTGVVCVYEAEARWDPKRKQSRYGRRRLAGHVDPKTGEVVPNRPTRAPASSPESHRELLGACALLDAVADESGVAAALRRALPRSWRRALTVAYYMVCEGPRPALEAAQVLRHARDARRRADRPPGDPRSCSRRSASGSATRSARPSPSGTGEAIGSSTARRRCRRTLRPSPGPGGAATRTAFRCRRSTWRCSSAGRAGCRCATAGWRAPWRTCLR